VTIPDAGRRKYRLTESSGRAQSVPRPAFCGAMLTLLRVRRVARLRRRPGSSTALPARFEERAPGSLLFPFGRLPLRSVPPR